MSLTAKPKRTKRTPDRRMAGRHHKHNDSYLKTYWPYLPMVLMVALGITVNTVWGSVQKGVLGYATDVSVGSLLQDTNDQRTSNSLGSLVLNAQLDQAAQAKANDMAARDYWSHNTPDGQTPWTFITNAGYNYETAGENLAYGFDTSANTVTAWMNSPEHRANILNTTYKDVGFGFANSPNYQGTGEETIVVAMYGSQQTVAAAPAPSTPATTQPAQTQPTPTPTPTPAASTPTETNSTPAPATKPVAKPASTPVASTKPVTRIQLLANSQAAPWSVFAVSTIATLAVAIFLLRHGLMWHRFLVKGERFIMKHKLLDLSLVAVAMLGIVLTRVVGVIR